MSFKILRWVSVLLNFSYLIIGVFASLAWLSYVIFFSQKIGGTELQGLTMLMSVAVLPLCLGSVVLGFLTLAKLWKQQLVPVILIILAGALEVIITFFTLRAIEINQQIIGLIVLIFITAFFLQRWLLSKFEKRSNTYSLLNLLASLILIGVLIVNCIAMVLGFQAFKVTALDPLHDRQGTYVRPLNRSVQGLEGFVPNDIYKQAITNGGHLIINGTQVSVQPDGSKDGYVYDWSNLGNPKFLGYQADLGTVRDARDNIQPFIVNYDPVNSYNPSPVDAYIYRKAGNDIFRYVLSRNSAGIEFRSIAVLSSNGKIFDIAVKDDLIFVLTQEEGLFIFSQNKIRRAQK